LRYKDDPLSYQAKNPEQSDNSAGAQQMTLEQLFEIIDDEAMDDLKAMICEAYKAGALAVHDNWLEGSNPDFTEAAHDYAAHLFGTRFWDTFMRLTKRAAKKSRVEYDGPGVDTQREATAPAGLADNMKTRD
jgi:hypothetical protein